MSFQVEILTSVRVVHLDLFFCQTVQYTLAVKILFQLLDYTARTIGISHAGTFLNCHKLLKYVFVPL